MKFENKGYTNPKIYSHNSDKNFKMGEIQEGTNKLAFSLFSEITF